MAEQQARKSGRWQRWRERRRAKALSAHEAGRRAKQQLAADQRRNPSGPSPTSV